MKLLLIILTLAFISCVAYASDMALYAGNPNPDWYAAAQVKTDATKIINELKSSFGEIKSFDDKALNDLKTWVDKNTKDGETDIIWLNGCTPSVLYANPNKAPDGSPAEEWLNNGNMIINIGDWFAYCTYETGARGADNGAAGAENILNLPGIIRSADNTSLDVTDAGKKYMPSLGAKTITFRPIVGTAVKAPWEVAEVFAGKATGDMDPCVLRNTKTKGYMAFINQAALAGTVDRAKATIEFIKNWVGGNAKLIVAVESQDKLATSWGDIKK